MSDTPAKGGAKALVSDILAATPAAATTPAAPAPVAAPPVDPDSEAKDLIEVYFDLEEPDERDVLFDQLCRLDTPVVTEFLRTMLSHDEDDYVRAEAACELCRRGDADGIAALEADLADPEEPYFFERAVQALAEIRGPAFYDTAAALWRDPERDAEERREAMLGMETADPARAVLDFVRFVDSITDIATMPDDQVEVAMLAFVRHAHRDAEPALEALKARIAKASMDEEERLELVAFVQEGLDLLAGA
ncbi:MAG: HEAT repeat domain-containing protein [Deltaproteobacteria bacterium]|nr:HEAT repeat domain-containing protein [Deltaproteobacteria bacterium]